MAELEQTRLGAILVQLRTVNGPEHLSRAFLEIRDTSDGREVTIRANSAGLAYLAQELLELAASASSGRHVHIDEAGMADHCDRNLVVTYASAPWE